jgi:hypothetical protein
LVIALRFHAYDERAGRFVTGNPAPGQGTYAASKPVDVTSQPIANHQPVTIMSNAVRSLALGDPSLAGLEQSTAHWVTLSLVWAGAIVLVFAPLAAALHRRSG